MPPSDRPWDKIIREGFILPSVYQLDVPATIMTVQQAVETHLLESGLVIAHLKALPKGPGTSCPDSPIDELVQYVARQRGQIDKSDPVVNLVFLLDYVFPALRLEREMVGGVLSKHPDLSLDEQKLLVLAIELAPWIDKLWQDWFTAICIPYQSLSDDVREVLKLRLDEQLPSFDYTIYDLDGGQVKNRRAWAHAFPAIIGQIARLLFAASFNSSELNTYCQALARAYGCTDIDLLEQSWREVDVAFVKLPRTMRFIPMHGIESGYEHARGVSPDFQLLVRTSIFAEEIAEYRTTAQEWAKGFLIDADILTSYLTKSGQIDAAVFVEPIRAGSRANFRFGGQNMPNRADVTIEHGGRVTLDPTVGRMLCGPYQEMIKRVCTPVTAEALAPLITPESFLDHAAVHEFTHPLARSVEVDKALGSAKDLLEEAKTSSGGIAAVLRKRPERALFFIAHCIARVGRFCTKTSLEDPPKAPYVRENLAVLTALFQCEIAEITSEGLAVDFDKVSADSWAEKLELLVAGVIDAYTDHDIPALHKRTDEYCNREPETPLGNLVAWINRS